MFSTKLKLKDGQLVYSKESNTALNLFIEKLSEGQEVDVFMSISEGKGSAAQISKVHKCIRELAKESGYSFDDMKKLVKEHAGLLVDDNKKSQSIKEPFIITHVIIVFTYYRFNKII